MVYQIENTRVGCFPNEVTYFKEEMISEVLVLPIAHGDMQKILEIMVLPEIREINLIETPKGRSYEGQYLSGYKLIVEMALKRKLTYIAHEVGQGTYGVPYETLKSISVILPEEIGGKSVSELYRLNRLVVSAYVEETCERRLDNRAAYQGVMLLVDVTVC